MTTARLTTKWPL